jgi:mannose-6-phosphate isomerase-like protein (cupin superfamily)
MKKLRQHVHETDRPQVRSICGSAIDLINTRISGSEKLSLAVIYVDPGMSSKPHYHKKTEEIYFFLEGSGRVIVGDREFEVRPGSAVHIPVLKQHHVVNNSTAKLKFISADSPPFDLADIFEA